MTSPPNYGDRALLSAQEKKKKRATTTERCFSRNWIQMNGELKRFFNKWRARSKDHIIKLSHFCTNDVLREF